MFFQCMIDSRFQFGFEFAFKLICRMTLTLDLVPFPERSLVERGKIRSTSQKAACRGSFPNLRAGWLFKSSDLFALKLDCNKEGDG